jgi:hypothetical protein
MKNINDKCLSEEFNMEYVEAEVKEVRKELSGIDIPDQILFANVLRANRILDKLEECQEGKKSFSTRAAEVASQLINAVTQATSQIMTDTYNKGYLQLRQDLVKLKELEIKIKQRAISTPRSQNLILADRESVLKFLQGEVDRDTVDGEVIDIENPKQIEE